MPLLLKRLIKLKIESTVIESIVYLKLIGCEWVDDIHSNHYFLATYK